MDMNRHNLFTFNFKENLIFCIKLIILLGIVLVMCLHIMPQYQGAYTAALLDKVERLNSIEQPKLVLLGNSNLAFGMNSEKIEDALGMPVVNMGLHGGLGNAFHEEMGKMNVTEGDINKMLERIYQTFDISVRKRNFKNTIVNSMENV